jgi:argininosuccinate lyase
MRGIDRTHEMLAMLSTAIPRLGVKADVARAALRNEVFATDAVMARVADGEPFRRAYRDIAARVKRGESVPEPDNAALLRSRTSSGGLGNLPLAALQRRMRAAQRWNTREQRRFDVALDRLVKGRSR